MVYWISFNQLIRADLLQHAQKNLTTQINDKLFRGPGRCRAFTWRCDRGLAIWFTSYDTCPPLGA